MKNNASIVIKINGKVISSSTLKQSKIERITIKEFLQSTDFCLEENPNDFVLSKII